MDGCATTQATPNHYPRQYPTLTDRGVTYSGEVCDNGGVQILAWLRHALRNRNLSDLQK